MRSNKFLLFLEIIFLLHDMPIIGYHFPSVVYAIIVIFLFYTLCRRIGVKKIGSYLPIFIIPILRLFIDLFQIDSFYVMLQTLSVFIQTCIYPMIAVNIIMHKKQQECKIIFSTYLAITFITGITTFLCLQTYPNAIREVVAQSTNHPLYSTFMTLNLGGFNYIFGLLFIEICTLYLLKNSFYFKYKIPVLFISIILLVSIITIIYVSEFTMAILIALSILSILILPRKFTLKHIITLLVAAFVIYFVSKDFIIEKISEIATMVDSNDVSIRLADIASSLQGRQTSLGSDVELRQEVWSIPLFYFLSKPWGAWGISDTIYTGGHSYILDSLATFGIFSIICFYYMFRCIYKQVMITLDSKEKGYALIGILVFILTALINPQLYINYLLFFMPLFFYFIKHSKLNEHV